MWIIPQHHKQIDRFNDIINLIKTANDNKLSNIREGIIAKLKNTGKYSGGKKETTSSANHNIDEPFFYGLIYKFQKKVFISKYGELINLFWDKSEKRNLIFLFSLFNIQYKNPAKKECDASLYPFRLIFKVVTDKRIENKISIDELYFFYKHKEVKDETVENIIKDLILYRSLSLDQKIAYLKKDNVDFVKSYISASYCFVILQRFGIFKKPTQTEESFIIKSDNRKKPTLVKLRYFSLSDNILGAIENILKKYPEYEEVKKSALPSELISEIYNFLAPEVWDYIKDEDIKEKVEDRFKLPSLIYDYSINPDKCYEFEEVIKNAFNQFYNIKAELASGAGDTDVVAKYMPNFPDDIGYKIFTADAKSTKNSLSNINSGRLDHHRNKHNGEFTIVVTPKYVPSVVYDISKRDIVIIPSLVLSELIKNVIKNDKNDFCPIYNIIKNNLGKDISDNIYRLIEDSYGVDI
jgi:type II restriction enzyme